MNAKPKQWERYERNFGTDADKASYESVMDSIAKEVYMDLRNR